MELERKIRGRTSNENVIRSSKEKVRDGEKEIKRRRIDRGVDERS